MHKNINELWLIWQDSKTRLRHKIGKLWLKKGIYYFAYDNEGLKSAVKGGYQLHPAFPIREVYKSEKLFPAFAMRLPNKERPDYHQFLSKYGLKPESSDLEILAATGGKLATDNYEFVIPLYACENLGFNHEFYVAGWKYWEGPDLLKDNFIPGTLLKIVPEPNNKYDKFALQVKTVDGHKIGYIPAFYSKLVYHYIAKGCNCELRIIEFEPQNDSSHVLKVKLICDKKCK